MSVANITGQGLCVIAILVALLWGCLIGERVIVSRANTEARQALRQVRLLKLKRQVEPASAPLPLRPHRPSLG